MSEDAKTFTQEHIDELNAKHAQELKDLEARLKGETDRKVDAAIKKTKTEIEEATKKANMSETEKLTAELEDYKNKYQQEADKNALMAQKDEARKLMAELGVDEKCLDFCFIPKDAEGTAERIKSFKEYVNGVEKATFEKNVGSKPPKDKQDDGEKDAFLQGFDK